MKRPSPLTLNWPRSVREGVKRVIHLLKITRIKHELIDRVVQTLQSAKNVKGGQRGAKRITIVYDDRVVQREYPESPPIPFFAIHQDSDRHLDASVKVVDPRFDEDIDELAEKLQRPQRTREERREIYDESVRLLKDYEVGAAGALLDQLAMSGGYQGGDELPALDEDEVMGDKAQGSVHDDDGSPLKAQAENQDEEEDEDDY